MHQDGERVAGLYKSQEVEYLGLLAEGLDRHEL